MRRILAVLVATAAVFVAAPAVAQAHHGDWWTQYNITHQHCWGCGYASSQVYGDHSRVFKWVYYTYTHSCEKYIFIGHSYEVWRVDGPYCFQRFYNA